jgi:predicted membrane-bound spermidine synthase
MSLEMVAFRLYAPYFGFALEVWGVMIAIIMAAMAIGYAVGGRLADRSQSDRRLFLIILAGAGYQLALLFCTPWLMEQLAEMNSIVAGTTVASLLIFAPPVTALAAVGPFVVRLLARTGSVGSAAGTVSAVATVGSIAGVLGTTFLLIPDLGTTATLQINCAASLLLAVIGLFRSHRLAAAAILPLGLLPFTPDTGWSEEMLWVEESPYNLVRVAEIEGRLLLILNHESAVHSIDDPQSPWTDFYWDDFALGPMLVETERVLVLGMGGGSSIAATWMVDPDIDITAVEIDPAVVEAAHRFFELPRASEQLDVQIADARRWLTRSSERYDVIQSDLYHGGAYVPFHVITEEFFREVADHLEEDGLLMLNVFDMGPDRAILERVIATLDGVFPAVFVRSRGDVNHLVLAFASDRSLASVRGELLSYRGEPTARGIASAAAAVLREVHPAGSVEAFTDDHAPVEPLIREMLEAHRTGR